MPDPAASPGRPDSTDVPDVMAAVVLTGHGGFDRLEYRTDVPVPSPAADEVLVRVHACGLNNTDVNTRTGWYASSVREGTTAEGTGDAEDGSWTGGVGFPRIQGADVCGEVVGAAAGELLGARVLIDPWILDPDDPSDLAAARYFGSEVDGGFAEYCVAPVRNVHAVDTSLTDAELATFACSSGTAENLVTRAAVGDGDVVAITGASGGVGTAAIQIAVARGAHVVAIARVSKADELRALGAHAVVDRDGDDLAAAVRDASPGGRVDALIDVVGGRAFEQLLPVVRPGGHYACSGAIAGPIVEFDLRTMYLNDLTMAGATVCPPGTFARVVDHIESGVLRPVLASTYPLAELVEAQRAFVAKRHVGNIVVTMR